MRPMFQTKRSDSGQILVIFAVAMVALILITGLVIDGGNAFLHRRDSQNSADIAAMAATKRLADYYVKGPTDPSFRFTATNNAYTTINTRMTQNGCTAATSCTWTARYVGARSGATFRDRPRAHTWDGRKSRHAGS